MKKVLIFMSLAMFSACTSSTPYGRCVGLNGAEDPKLVYEYSLWNIVVGFSTLELIVPPVVVLLEEIKCPVGDKK